MKLIFPRFIHFSVTIDEYGKNHATMHQNMPKEYIYLKMRSELNWNINASYFVSAEITNYNNFSSLNFHSDVSILGYDTALLATMTQ